MQEDDRRRLRQAREEQQEEEEKKQKEREARKAERAARREAKAKAARSGAASVLDTVEERDDEFASSKVQNKVWWTRERQSRPVRRQQRGALARASARAQSGWGKQPAVQSPDLPGRPAPVVVHTGYVASGKSPLTDYIKVRVSEMRVLLFFTQFAIQVSH